MNLIQIVSNITAIIMIVEAVLTVYLVFTLSKHIPKASVIPLVFMTIVVVATALWTLLVLIGVVAPASEFGFYVVRSILVVLLGLPSWVMLALSGPCTTCPYLPQNYGEGDKQ
jgi:hypothetical protein